MLYPSTTDSGLSLLLLPAFLPLQSAPSYMSKTAALERERGVTCMWPNTWGSTSTSHVSLTSHCCPRQLLPITSTMVPSMGMEIIYGAIHIPHRQSKTAFLKFFQELHAIPTGTVGILDSTGTGLPTVSFRGHCARFGTGQHMDTGAHSAVRMMAPGYGHLLQCSRGTRREPALS